MFDRKENMQDAWKYKEEQLPTLTVMIECVNLLLF